MDAPAFLSAVLPDIGKINITTINGAQVAPYFLDDVSDVVSLVNKNNKVGLNVYYSMATYKKSGSRKRDNANMVKSFWLDLDCGDKTPYKTPQDGLEALNNFSEAASLPTPYAVCSGGGIHAYWVLTEAITPEEWSPIAERLPLLCAKFDLSLKDSGPTRDIVRILRVPGTKNYKDINNPTDVYLMQEGEPVSFNEFKTMFIEASGDLNPTLFAPDGKITSLMPYDRDNDVFSGPVRAKFFKILKEGHCNQITNAIMTRATIEEPRWRAALSIANRCIDKVTAIKVISQDHPGYNFDEAVKKAEATMGPYTCAIYKRDFPQYCEGCTAKVKSPVTLGNELQEAPTNEILVPKTHAIFNVDTEEEEEVQTTVSYTVTDYPFPYRRGVNGGIYIQEPASPEGIPGKIECVYENDLYAVRRYHDEVEGESVLGRLHLPHDGVREFIIPLRTVLTPDKLRDALATHGVAATKKNMDRIMGIFTAQIKGLQSESSAKLSRRQFGWHDRDSCFVVGDREVRGTEIVYSPPSAATTNIVQEFQPKGNLEAWKQIADTLNAPGFELQAFAFLAGLGSPLLKYTGQNGCFINLVSEQSGTGKTTTLRLINSLWGHPKETMLLPDDTINSRMYRIGVYGNIAACMDEITNLQVDALSAMLYGIYNGRDKHRMQSGVNQERVNRSTWSLIAFGSANSTIRDKVSTAKAKSEGENMRLFEFYIDKAGVMGKEESDRIYSPLLVNYGLAGPEFIQYILNHPDECDDILREEQINFDNRFKTESKERVWSAVVSCAFAAARIADKANLLHWDIDRIRAAAMVAMLEQRQDVLDVVEDSNTTLGNFMADNAGSIIIVDNNTVSATMSLDHTLEKARVKIVGRHEKHTNTLYISQTAFRDYCTRRQISYNMALANLKKEPWFIGVENKRLSTGTGLTLPPIRVLHMQGEFEFSKK